jgi:hypothetical protein
VCVCQSEGTPPFGTLDVDSTLDASLYGKGNRVAATHVAISSLVMLSPEIDIVDPVLYKKLTSVD